MTRKSFTIQLDGRVTLDRFYQTLEAWHGTLQGVSAAVGEAYPPAIVIEDLSYGSALAIVGMNFDQETAASQFEESYESVGRHLRNNSVYELPRVLQESGKRLQEAAKLDGGAGFTLSSEDADFLIDPARWTNAAGQPTERADNVEAYGIVIGKLQSLSSRGTLKVMVFDELYDKAVRVSITEEQHEVVRKLWDAVVIVDGVVRRDPDTGRPLSVTNVQNIARKEVPDNPFAWREARGALAHIHPEKSSEQLIREARNA